MSKPRIKSILLIALVFFIANMGIWSFSSNRLAHMLEHSGNLQVSSTEHADIYTEATGDYEEQPHTSDHQLLHAVEHLQFFPGTAFIKIIISAPNNDTFLFPSHIVPFTIFESPFRPPRLSS